MRIETLHQIIRCVFQFLLERSESSVRIETAVFFINRSASHWLERSESSVRIETSDDNVCTPASGSVRTIGILSED